MRTTERLRRLKEWAERVLCEGREMKTPGQNFDISDIKRREPKVYLAWAPSRMDAMGHIQENASENVCPCIIILPNQSYVKNMEEHRFDRYDNVHRPPEMGARLSVSMLFMIYEPGIRLPGFVGSVGEKGKGMDMSKILEGTEEGLFTLMDWMDDCKEALLASKTIPHTDLILEESTATYSLYTDQSFVVDRRPIYYGFVNVTFDCHADEGTNRAIDELLN